MVTHVDGGADDHACHDPQPAAVVVFAVQLGCGIEPEGLDSVWLAFRHVAAQQALRRAHPVEVEELLGAAFIFWWSAMLVEGEHRDAQDGEEEAKPDEIRLRWVLPVFIVLSTQVSIVYGTRGS